ncbi:MAG TPA: hypothetical protein VN414_05925 [Methanosarcina sp.]|nr:hypothetical protein [Methanosarcina sp.]
MPASLFKKLLERNPFQKRLDRKPRVMFRFEDLIPKPYRRDYNPFQKRLDRKPVAVFGFDSFITQALSA